MVNTLMELKAVLGKNIEDLQDKKASDYDRSVRYQRAEQTANLAKQFNNIAKIVLNADQMSNRSDRIDEMIGK